MTFSTEMIKLKNQLEKEGHIVELPCDIDLHLQNPKAIDDLDEDLRHCIKNKVLKTAFEQVARNDAIIILNLPKNGVPGYIGTSSLMEMAVAYHLNKKIFLWNELPKSREARWAHEVQIIEPIILDAELNKVK